MNKIPWIDTIKTSTGYEAFAALKLNSLLGMKVLIDIHQEQLAANYLQVEQSFKKKLHHSREMFLSTVAAWGDSATFELRFDVDPDLIWQARGEVGITLIMYCYNETADLAKEILAQRYLSLMPILETYQQEAIWEPVLAKNDLSGMMVPFTATHALGIQRKHEKLCLSSALTRKSIGFVGSDDLSADDIIIQHQHLWRPSFDDWSRLLTVLMGQMDPVRLTIRLKPMTKIEPAVEHLAAKIQQCEKLLVGQKMHLAHHRLIELLRDDYLKKLAGLKEYSFSVGVFLLASHRIDTSLGHALGHALTSSRLESGDPSFFSGGFDIEEVTPADAMSTDYFLDRDPFSLSETACAFRLPAPSESPLTGIKLKNFRTSLARMGEGVEDNSQIKMFLNMHRGLTQPIYVDATARMRHCFIVGQTGTGKSTLMESMALQDIENGQGVALIDPHGDLVDNLLGRIPAERINDVILLDFVDRKHPFGFNLLEWQNIEERDLIIDELYRALDHIYDLMSTGGPIFEMYFRGAMKLLMGDKVRPGYVPTLLEFVKCFTDSRYRKWLAESISDQQLHDFVETAENANGEASLRNITPYITSKFSRFTSDVSLSRIIGQSKSTVTFDSIMEQGKILLVKLGKGRFGSHVSALLANMIVAKFKFAAMKRGDMPVAKRRDYFLYVDEAHNLPRDNFSEMLAEARKYRLGLVLSTQFCSQLKSSGKRNNDDLTTAIFGNVGTTIVFRTGIEDAETLAKGLYPAFTWQDIVNLPNYHGYARMNLGDDVNSPFSFVTEPIVTEQDTARAATIIKQSQVRYGRRAEEVDKEISRRNTEWKTMSFNT